MDELFDTMTDERDEPEISDEPEAVEPDEDEDDSEESEDTRPTVSDIPKGAVSVTEFARDLTLLPGNPYGYITPQTVYQVVRAKRNPLPHVLVKTEDDAQPRVYVLREQAMAEWAERASRLETRGTSGTVTGSKRSPEQLKDALSKEDGALWKVLYAQSRRDMWDGEVADRQKTVDKYHRWLKEAGVSADEISDLAASVKEAFDAAEQAKVEEREAKAKAAKEAREAKKNGNPE
jgi:hypothetical protein